MKTNYFIHFNRISSLLLTTFFLLRNHFEKKKTYHHLPVSLIPAKLSNEKYTNSFLFHSPPPIEPPLTSFTFYPKEKGILLSFSPPIKKSFSK